MEESIEILLAVRRRERDTLLKRAVDLLRSDTRIGAAWLFGSLGRNAADDLSDLDLWTVVAHDQIDGIVAARRAYVAQLGEPLLVLESPQNAPAGGGYLLVLYGGEAGPQQVDWYWQSQFQTYVPGDAKLLFDRIGLPVDVQHTTLEMVPSDQAGPIQTAAQRATFFWAMSCIAAKKIARQDSLSAQTILPMIAWALHDVRNVTATAAPAATYEATARIGDVPAAARDQLALLRNLAHTMEALTPTIDQLAWNVAPNAIREITRFFDLAEAML